MFISPIGAPERSSALLTACFSASVRAPAGATQFAEPPPESRTSTRSSAVAEDARFSARAALSMLPWSGTGWPAATIGIWRVVVS